MKRVHLVTSVIVVVASTLSVFSAPGSSAPKEYAVYAPSPQFSYEARRNRTVPGDGLFELHVRPNGTVTSVAVLKSTGRKIIDIEAAAAFAKWRFRPGVRKPVKIPLSFKREW